jgi:hypothetical protein
MAGFFTEEWERFRQGTRMLDPDAFRLEQQALGRQQRRPGETRTINVPGWEDIVKLGPRYEATRAERDAFSVERRTGQRASLSAEARHALTEQRAVMERMRTSATPDFAKGIQQILTANDNVQDLLSSMATFGRLALWAGPRLVTHLSALHGPAGAALASVGAKIGLRFTPGLGWLITAADLLNYLGMIGLLSTPIFGLLCAGPTKALAAGLPTWMMRCSLRQEAWKLAHGGPFGRKARLDRAMRTRGRLPGMGNLFEVAQTTEQLWGWGMSLGGVVGLMTESAGAAFALLDGEPVSVNTADAGRQWNRLLQPRFEAMSPGERVITQGAARLAATVPSIHRTQEHFTEQEHLEALAMTLVALGHLQTVWHGLDVESALLEALDYEWAVPVQLSPTSRELLELAGGTRHAPPTWVLPGSPSYIRGADYVEGYAPLIARAVLDFLEPRRNRAEAAFYGALITEATEAAWLLATQNREALRYELADDHQLGLALAESGYLLNPTESAGALWRFWQAARLEISSGLRRTLYPADWQRLAAAHGVTLIPNLGPEALWPPEWTTPTAPAR